MERSLCTVRAKCPMELPAMVDIVDALLLVLMPDDDVVSMPISPPTTPTSVGMSLGFMVSLERMMSREVIRSLGDSASLAWIMSSVDKASLGVAAWRMVRSMLLLSSKERFKLPNPWIISLSMSLCSTFWLLLMMMLLLSKLLEIGPK